MRESDGDTLTDAAAGASDNDNFAGLRELRAFGVDGGIDIAVDSAGEGIVDGEAVGRREVWCCHCSV